MKVANVIVAHKNPEQLLRLVNRFPGEQFHNFIHVDGRCRLEDFAAVAQHPNVTMLPHRRKLVYAGYGFVQVTLEAFRLIVDSAEEYFYINVMSGQDYPVKSVTAFYDFLEASYGKEFFEIADMASWPQALHRYERFHLIDWTIKGRYRLEDMINLFIPKRKFFDGLVPYGRSAWFTATDEFIMYVLRYTEEHPDFMRYLKTVWSPDEFIYNTIVMNSPFRDKVINNNLRYIDWSEGNVSPKTFKTPDLDTLLKSDCFLARKFDEQVDSGVMDKLDLLSAKSSVHSAP